MFIIPFFKIKCFKKNTISRKEIGKKSYFKFPKIILIFPFRFIFLFYNILL